ncbi:hypothetical protein N9L06_05925 [Mariniblastus sp.]|nr:hypothetical protein [Mariniblastus sp.]
MLVYVVNSAAVFLTATTSVTSACDLSSALQAEDLSRIGGTSVSARLFVPDFAGVYKLAEDTGCVGLKPQEIRQVGKFGVGGQMLRNPS